MSEQTSERIKFLRRNETRKKVSPEFLEFINSISGKSFYDSDILTLDQIEENQTILNGSGFGFNYLNLSFRVTQIYELENLMQKLNHELHSEHYLYLNKFSDSIVLKGNLEFVVENLDALVRFDGDTFKIYDLNFKNGFWIDLFEDFWFEDGKTQKEWIYELRVFGKKYIDRIICS